MKLIDFLGHSDLTTKPQVTLLEKVRVVDKETKKRKRSD